VDADDLDPEDDGTRADGCGWIAIISSRVALEHDRRSVAGAAPTGARAIWPIVLEAEVVRVGENREGDRARSS
jgi:hypothetical protein